MQLAGGWPVTPPSGFNYTTGIYCSFTRDIYKEIIFLITFEGTMYFST